MEPKPGIKTTEFWVSLITILIGLAASLGFLTPGQADSLTSAIIQLGGLIVSVGASFGYSISRGTTKSNSGT